MAGPPKTAKRTPAGPDNLLGQDTCAWCGHPTGEAEGVCPALRRVLMRERQTLLMRLAEIEDTLGMPRTIAPRRRR